MPKNIVICIDGTGNQFGDCNSNVVKLFYCLKRDCPEQISFYHPGLGTMGSPQAMSKLSRDWTKLLGLAFGSGLSGSLSDCYTYLIENYIDGDSIFIFGFSRGAYTARALAAMVHMYGLVQRGNEPLIRYILTMFKKKRKSKEDFELAARFKDTFSRSTKIHFVGVWDTVSSVGWIYDPLTLPFTAMNPDIEVGRHAVSIDERRAAFRQNLWRVDNKPQNTNSSQDGGGGQDIRQVWFAGVHSDVGGGYLEAESGLAKIPLAWMLDEAEAQGLIVVQDHKNDILGVTNPAMSKPNCLAELHVSLCGSWRVLEFFPRRYLDLTLSPPIWKWKLPLGAPRYIPPGSVLHPSVAERMAGDPAYRPPNLPESVPGSLTIGS